MVIIKNKQFIATLKNPLVWLGIVAGILYSSWPLGFLLNPDVAHHALASQLESSNQPYNWLFIALDVSSGLALIITGIAQWLRTSSRLIKVSIVSYVLFAVLVIVAAIAPFNCNSVTNSCYNVAHTPLFIIHGLASIISVVFLLGSILLIFKMLFEKHAFHWLNALMVVLIGSWGLTGLSALIVYRHRRIDEVVIQYVFISICSMSVIMALALIEYLSKSMSIRKSLERPS